jgi:hypothetical protein
MRLDSVSESGAPYIGFSEGRVVQTLGPCRARVLRCYGSRRRGQHLRRRVSLLLLICAEVAKHSGKIGSWTTNFQNRLVIGAKAAGQGLGTQRARMEPTTNSRCSGRNQRSRKPVDQARTRTRRGGLEAQDCYRGAASPERGRTRQIARAVGPRSTSARFSRRCMDMRKGGRGDPKRVWRRLPPGTRKPFAQSFEIESAKARAPGESER